jgi:hypothetical protein
MRPLYRKVLPDGRIVEVWPQITNVHLTVTLPENDGLFHEDDW